MSSSPFLLIKGVGDYRGGGGVPYLACLAPGSDMAKSTADCGLHDNPNINRAGLVGGIHV